MRSKDFAQAFGLAVRKQRKARGLSQESLAEQADLSPKMISLNERFERNPSLNVVHSIAAGLAMPLWRLVKDAEDLRRKTAKPPKLN